MKNNEEASMYTVVVGREWDSCDYDGVEAFLWEAKVVENREL